MTLQEGKQRDALLASYGFGLFPVLHYQPARRGEWTIANHLPAVGDGYLTRAVVEERVVLSRGRHVWMSIGLLEKESHAWHVHCANGTVVTAGLGLGMFAYAAAMKPEVERVIVAEIDPDIIELMQQSSGFHSWPWREKVEILQVDALAADFADAVKAQTRGRSVDYLYADIWPNFPAEEAPAQTGVMARALKPRAAGWWGQELSFAGFCRARQQRLDEAGFRAFFAENGVPVPEVTEGYLRFCRDLMAAYRLDSKDTLVQRLRNFLAG